MEFVPGRETRWRGDMSRRTLEKQRQAGTEVSWINGHLSEKEKVSAGSRFSHHLHCEG